MTRNEFIAQAAIRYDSALASGVNIEGDIRWTFPFDACDSVRYAIELADELEQRGVAPWKDDK